MTSAIRRLGRKSFRHLQTEPERTAVEYQGVTKSTENCAVEHRERLEERIAKDLRHLRVTHGQTLEQISQYLGHEKNWLSKIERKSRRVYLSDYLLIIDRLRETEPDPVGLLDYYTHGPGRRLSVVKS